MHVNPVKTFYPEIMIIVQIQDWTYKLQHVIRRLVIENSFIVEVLLRKWACLVSCDTVVVNWCAS